MKRLLVKPQTKEQLKVLKELFKEMGVATFTISDENSEDIGMRVVMNRVDRTKKVSRKAIMKKLT